MKDNASCLTQLYLNSDKLVDCKFQITQLTSQVDNIFTTLDQSYPKCSIRGIIHSLFNFYFETQIVPKNVNLTYTETDTNRLLLKSLQRDILQISCTVHWQSKELKSLFNDRIFFIIMFQLRSHLTTLCNEINLKKITYQFWIKSQ